MTYRELVRKHALEQYGYITTAEAEGLAVPPVELRKLAARGALTHIGHGLYRLVDVPGNDLDEFAEAVFRVGADAYLTHDAVLAFHGLGLVNPRRIRVGTPHRVRTKLPESIVVVHRQLPPDALTAYEGIPSTTVAQAILDCRGLMMQDRLRDAVTQARKEGLLTRAEASRLRMPRVGLAA
jgi:predicted transcriptional regulator of viral defense system